MNPLVAVVVGCSGCAVFRVDAKRGETGARAREVPSLFPLHRTTRIHINPWIIIIIDYNMVIIIR